MPVFVIEREFAEMFDPDGDTLKLVEDYNAKNDIKWITSFLSSDKKKTYCLYEAADIEAIKRQAADLGLPADVITEVDQLTP
jgi:predicted DNA binding CopG/RHH family protein